MLLISTTCQLRSSFLNALYHNKQQTNKCKRETPHAVVTPYSRRSIQTGAQEGGGAVHDVLAAQNDDSLRPFNTLRAVSSEIMRHGTPHAGGCRVDALQAVDNTAREALWRRSTELLRVLHARAHGWAGDKRVGPTAGVPEVTSVCLHECERGSE